MHRLTEKENSGITAGSFGVVGLIFALQFFSEVPKVRNDIMQVCALFSPPFTPTYLSPRATLNRTQNGWKKPGVRGVLYKQGIQKRKGRKNGGNERHRAIKRGKQASKHRPPKIDKETPPSKRKKNPRPSTKQTARAKLTDYR